MGGGRKWRFDGILIHIVWHENFADYNFVWRLRGQMISNLDTGNNVSLCVLGYFTVSFRKKCSRLCPLKLLPLAYVAIVKKNLNVHYSQLD